VPQRDYQQTPLEKFVDPGGGEVIPPGPHHLKKPDGVGSLAAEPINESFTLNIRPGELSGNGETVRNDAYREQRTEQKKIVDREDRHYTPCAQLPAFWPERRQA